ncbi:hypothetical protein BKA63DRAFT_1702 [Paraphoma chrysanthemicola]|nr:hypothetical protein BKA63DRAFT_1702 [Paraphoma chrysanthemicola]
MRLLHYSESDELCIHSFDDGDIPRYAILSHTWGTDGDEVSFADLQTGVGKTKPGYDKILFCGSQARRDGLRYFWVDTCCINKNDKAELAFAIKSMFRWYRSAASCYAYLSDVSKRKKEACDRDDELSWEPAFMSSRWFTRGWTLQELLAPAAVKFFSREGESLGNKTSLHAMIREITGIPSEVLNGAPLSRYNVNERLRWAEGRMTGRNEDRAYCLQGILDIELAPVYGEGEAGAFDRLKRELYKLEQCIQDVRQTDPRDDKKRIEETKGGLLADSYHWVLDNTAFRQWREDKHSQLLWVKGDPGKGKTMLLCGVIDELQSSVSRTALLSYFFCQATDSRINSATAVLRGLLYMLLHQQPSLASHVRKKYDHAGKSLFNDANAWVAVSEIFADVLQDASLSTTYLVIDALDECVTDLPSLLAFIVKQSSASSRVKWIVSSRNWPDIEEELERAEHKTRLSLELNTESVAAAVKIFIQQKTRQLAQEKHYTPEMEDKVLQHLAANANDTFLWVALVCQDLKTTRTWNVLKKLAQFPPGLDSLYRRMLQQIHESDSAEICLQVLAVTTVLYRPVTVAELVVLTKHLADFTNNLESVREMISLCGSFLTLRDDTVYFVHQSAKDFLTMKASNLVFPDGAGCIHQDIFQKSLTVLQKTLRRDLYNLQAPGYPVGDVKPPDLDPLATSRYLCIYWVDHFCDSESKALAHSATNQEDASAIDAFLRQRYLYWLEALSLCGSIAKGVVSMTKLWDLVQGPAETHTLSAAVYDARRLIMYHKEAVEKYPLQVYASALLFSPADSLIRQLFQHEEPRAVAIKPYTSNGWSACLQTLEGHSGYVYSVAFSHDSARLASASGDGTVKIWDASSGACLQTLEGHSGYVYSVAFSHDSARLASASGDGTVKIWDASSGACLQTLEGHSSWVRSVAFSHDSARLASASGDGIVKIWDASSGACLQTLEGHSGYVYSVAFSHDSVRLASASDDGTVKIWDASSGACLQTLEGHSGSVSSDLSSILATQPSNEDVDESQQFLHHDSNISVDTSWISINSQKMLWLPSEYRPSCSTASGKFIGIGTGHGKVWIGCVK